MAAENGAFRILSPGRHRPRVVLLAPDAAVDPSRRVPTRATRPRPCRQRCSNPPRTARPCNLSHQMRSAFFRWRRKRPCRLAQPYFLTYGMRSVSCAISQQDTAPGGPTLFFDAPDAPGSCAISQQEPAPGGPTLLFDTPDAPGSWVLAVFEKKRIIILYF